MIDIVFPKDNEQEFIDIAKRLKLKGLCFVYPDVKSKETLDELRKNTKLKIYHGLLVDHKTAGKSKADLLIAKSGEHDRFLIEQGKANLLFELEQSSRKDFMHQKNAGLNQVLCRLASEKNKIIGFSFFSVLKAKPRQQSRTFGRMMQNVMVCRKYEVNMCLASFAEDPFDMRSQYELMSFGVNIGMHAKEAKDAVISVSDHIAKKKRRA